jgi:LDH2 family malate/lactate/ureidoglycolate dehydrogenase
VSDRIQQLADRARDHIPTLLLGMRDRIEAAITDAVEAAEENDAKAVLRIPVTITWDLDSVDVRIAATVSTRCKAEVTVQLDDDQPRLPLDGDDGEIPPQAKAAMDRIMDTARADGVTVATNRRLDV